MSDRLKAGYEMSHPEPGDEILITGLSGYFPECDSVAELQENLFNKVNLVTHDDRRWKLFNTEIPHGMGKINNLENFDASFFGIDFNLAHRVDPESRLLLERTYEAIIDAGMNPEEFRNSRTAVYAGCCFHESEKKLLYGKLNCNEHAVIGCVQSNLPCRVAQWLGVTGPAYTIDTACSSITYALEHAFKAIRTGVCDAAIICGVNITLHPYVSLQCSRVGVLSPQGISKSFDVSGNGYGRAEAATVCILQKAEDSRRAYAQLVYAKTKCDGFKNKGIAFPDGDAQRILLKEFYEECDIPAYTVEYMEAHGTGTTVGDPEELNAIDHVMCQDRTGPLLIGSIKSNMGHAEGASGLCSIAKICIAYHSGYIPPNLHFIEPRKEIPALAEGRLKVLTEKQAWNCGLASVNGFGFGGSNAHALFRNFDKKKINNGIPNDSLPRLVCISGRTKSSVELILNSLESKSLDAEEIRLWHAIHESNIRGHKYRGFVLLKSTPAGSVTLGRDVTCYDNTHRPVCLLYPGACIQPVLVQQLMDIPEFAAAIYKCNAALKGNNINLVDIMSGNISTFDNNLHLYIMTVALQIGITDIIRNIGIKPDSFLGYGIGELCSAYTNGSLTLEEAMDTAYHQALVLKNTTFFDGNTNKNIIVDDKTKFLTVNDPTAAHRNNKNSQIFKTDKEASTEDICSDMIFNSSGLKDYSITGNNIIPLIPTNAIVIQVTPERSLRNILKSQLKNEVYVHLIEEDTSSAEHDFFVGLGRLYNAGLNFKTSNLYPIVPFPVSQNTPMLSHLVEWDHRENWYRYSYFENRSKMDSVERIVKISISDPDLDYLHGHYIDGRHLYPGPGYLLLVWETLAMIHGRVYKEFSIVFEKVEFLRATTIPKKGELLFKIIIHPVSGEFEVSESKTAVVTGIIYPKKNIDTITTLDGYKNSEKIKLSQKDFYKEMKLRGYDYSGNFKGVLDSNIDGSYSRVTWANNWVVYMDYIFQVIELRRDTRNLYIPTGCAKLSIDTDLHYKILAEIVKSSNQSCIDVYIDKTSQVIRSGGLEIRGFETTMISKKVDLNVPIFETYDFIPHHGKRLITFNDIIRLFVNLIIENTQVYKFKAIEIFDETYNIKKYRPMLEDVHKVLEIIPQVWAELNVVTNTYNINKSIQIPLYITELNQLPEDKSAVLLVGTNLSQKKQILRDSELCLREGGFIISREEDDTTIMDVKDEFDIVAMHDAADAVWVLLKKKIKVEEKLFIQISDQSLLWITKIKEALEQNKKIVLYAQDVFSGILGLINCLRKETDGDKIQCIFVIDPDKPPFDPELQFYKNQLEKNLSINVFKDGQWGTYGHNIMKDLDLVKPVPHAYVNIETIGDLSSIKWCEGSFTSSIQQKDEDLLFVNVYCAALNFQDMGTATGQISVDAVTRDRLAQENVQGFEFAGKLTNGMRVIGMAEHAISNLVLCNRNLMTFIPDEWTFEEAASVMVAYSTVYMAFDILGKVKTGESILIHAGSGGIGQAAINVALHRGCDVFTTVETPEKRDFIKKLYPQLKDNHIGNSRDTSFEQLVMKGTNDKGVDIVVNSLSEDKLLASIRCLSRRGRFLEIGKYIFKDTSIEMSCQNKEISFHGVTLGYVFDNISDGTKLVELVTKGISNGEVRPITNCTFEKYDVEAAYRYMASGKHIGKVVIKIRKEDNEKLVKPKNMLIDAKRRYMCDKDYVYILVGGLGGFGLELADWLILRGARKLVFVSSKGVSTGYQALRLRTWKSYGVQIYVLTDNIATESGCTKILHTAVAMGHVEAIFNMAGILNDALFPQLSPELFQKSLEPKALATLYLDKLSRHICVGLRDFVVFSSFVCGRGNAGQSNYGLANSVMERICEKRRKDGLPGLAIQWGKIDDVGMLADLQEENGAINLGGIIPQRIASCLRALDALLLQRKTIVSCYVLAQKKVIENEKKTAVETIAQIIGVKNLKTISYQVSLAELGMDSIMAMEVKQTLERDFDIVLTAPDIRTMSFAKLISLSSESQESDSHAPLKAQAEENWIYNLRNFLRKFGEEENAFKPFINMTTKYFTNNEMNMDMSSTKTLFMIPGLEGCAVVLEPLCKQLHTNACVIQLPFDDTCDLQNMTDKLYKVIRPLLKHTSSFNLLGYSYGTIPLFSLAAKLESEGYIGRLFCIDGSPAWIRSIFERIGFTDDVTLENNILKYVLEAIVANKKVITTLIKETSELANYDDKINYIYEHSSKDLIYTKAFLKIVAKECENRIKIVKDFNSIEKIKSHVVLLRPEHGVINNFAENYELDKFTEGDVKVHILKGNHISILDDPNCAIIIDKYLNDN